MTYQRLPYDDAASTPEMAADCAEVGRELRLPSAHAPLGGRLGGTPPHPARRPAVDVPPGLAEMAAGLELHFD